MRRRLWRRLRKWWALGALPLALACGSSPPTATSHLEPSQGDVPAPVIHEPPLPLALDVFDGRQRAPGSATGLSVDPSGGVWVIDGEGGLLVRPAGGTFFRSIPLAVRATAVAGLGDGVALVGQSAGVTLVRIDALGNASLQRVSVDGYVHDIRSVDGGSVRRAIVAGTTGLFLVHVDGSASVVARRLPDPPDQEIWTAAPAPDGSLWFATFEELRHLPGVGSDDLSQPVDMRLDLAPGRPDGTVAVDACQDGDVWAATLGNGVYRISARGEQLAHLTRSGVLPQDHVISVACDPEGGVWLGTSWGGIARLHGDGAVDYHTRDAGLPGDSIRALVPFVDSTGRAMWIATEGGVAVYRGP